MSDSPRTDAFIKRLPPIEMNRPFVEVVNQIHALMLAWSEFARELERELMKSVPREWGEEPFRNGPDTKF